MVFAADTTAELHKALSFFRLHLNGNAAGIGNHALSKRALCSADRTNWTETGAGSLRELH